MCHITCEKLVEDDSVHLQLIDVSDISLLKYVDTRHTCIHCSLKNVRATGQSSLLNIHFQMGHSSASVL